ncbi:zinc-ribbon domain-containing protein [Aliiruegeria lutimaris]|uniref:MJ0042 family finger-like domain-containing protein n=1 Tax=Aliiruegeria lutimaris TaxID=571298 RepID=A0A1G8ZW70_9RHOB|nr:zinc-ribbon domain-containing protein [Aliiruegeria lutimaris]SDK19303.1 MJ0042 family finger-like domain-containing protein [Aliiruegeria lutimaris]
MRLTCPNCGAQYAVDARVIPDTGRDVQCSNCGKTWFQHHPDHPSAPETPVEEPEISAPPPPDPEPEPPARQPASVAPASAAVAEPETADEIPDPALGSAAGIFDEPDEPDDLPIEADLPDEATPEVEEKEPEEAPDSEPIPPRRPVDAAAMAVLREEAAREQAARQAERGALETQGELDMPAPERAARRPEPDLVPREPARVVPSDTIPAEEEERSDKPAPRRERLPDVEEINSTLRPEEAASARSAENRVPREERSRGRRIGMGLAFLVFGGLALLYSQHKTVADKLPQAAPVLEQYVTSVDAARLRLDRALRSSVARLQGSGE